MKIMKRNGTEAAFDAQKIVVAISKARDEAACGDLSDEQIHTIAGEIKGRCEGLGYTQVPIWMKYTMSIEEAAQYFRIGENKLRKMVRENRDADFVLWNGSRPQIKRKSFEKYIDAVCAV